MSILRSHFSPDPSVIYLDSATYGLPPKSTMDAYRKAADGWESGLGLASEWDKVIGDASRAAFAELLGTAVERVALVPTVSVGTGLVAASLPIGCEVVIPEDEFTSVSFPMQVAEQRREVRLRIVPFNDLASSIGPETHLVAFSLVRSQSGEMADLPAILAAAERHGAQVLVDSTHATPFIDLAPMMDRIDYLVCHGYKHLLCPRGVGFFVIRPDRWEETAPWLANWSAASMAFSGAYGGPLALEGDAARFNLSLAWHAWVGGKESLELLAKWNQEGLLAHGPAMARRLAKGLELPEPPATLVSLRPRNAAGAEAALTAAGIRYAGRAGFIRLSTHVYTTIDEIDHAIGVLSPYC